MTKGEKSQHHDWATHYSTLIAWYYEHVITPPPKAKTENRGGIRMAAASRLSKRLGALAKPRKASKSSDVADRDDGAYLDVESPQPPDLSAERQ